MKLPVVAASCLFGALVAAGCEDLPDVEEEGCGNLVLNVDEDCDGFATLGDEHQCGDPGTTNECRYVCSATEGPPCPAGWGCGADGRCRRPAGAFHPALDSPWRFQVSDFGVGDVDGDGYIDVVGHDVSTLTVRFGSETGDLVSEIDVVTRPPKGPVSYGDLDADGLLDVLMPIAEGLFVMLGQPDRTLEPVAYSPIAIEAAADLIVAPVESDSANLNTELLTIVGNQMEFLGAAVDPRILPSGHLAGDIAGHVPAGDLNRSDGDARAEFALAFGGEAGVWIFTSTGVGLTLRAIDYQYVDLQGNATVDEGARFADVNGDGYLDLMVSLRDFLDQPRVAVALGDNTGSLEPTATVRDVFDRQLTSPWPLAAGDLNSDGKSDYVMPEAILIADFQQTGVSMPTSLTPTAFITTEPWSEAVLGDFNGDSHVDVATAIEGTDGVDFFFNAMNSGFFNKFHEDTENPPKTLRVGDFDGDFIDDVAFAETGFGSTPDSLAVMYGSTFGGPSLPVFMGSLSFIEILEPFSFVTTTESLDVISDLFVVSESFPDRESFEIAIMLGSSSRRMLSPFTLQPEIEVDEEQPDVPRRAFFGHFDPGEDDLVDIVAIADKAIVFDEIDGGGGGDSPGDVGPEVLASRIWLIPGKGGGQLDATEAASADLPDFEQFDTPCAVWAAGNLDPPGSGGRAEVVGIDNDSRCYGFGFSPVPRLLVGRIVEGEEKPELETTITDLPGDARAVRDVWLLDLDDDGDLDLLALFVGEIHGSVTGSAPEEIEGAAVVVIWNDDGDLDVANPVEMTFSDPVHLFDIAPIHLDADRVPELAILSGSGGYLARLDANTLEYQVELDSMRSAIPDIRKGRLEVADFNLDGLLDLAVTDDENLHVQLAKEAGPLGAEQTDGGGQ